MKTNLSKSTKIKLVVIIGVLFLIGGVLGYLAYVGKIKLSASGVVSGSVRGASLSKGATVPSKTWYFAEGCTRSNPNNFDTFLLLQNPGDQKANVKVTFVFGNGQGEPVVKDFEVNPTSRYTIYVESYIGAEKDVAMKIESDQPIVAERSMYFIYNNKLGSSSNIGIAEPAKRFYFPEGTTWDGFDEYILLFNPNEKDIEVTLKLIRTDKTEEKKISVKKTSRETIHLNELVGDYKGDVAVVAVTDKDDEKFVAERDLYFASGDKSGGASSMGLAPDEGGTEIYFSESYVTSSGSFDEWVAVFAPWRRDGKTAQVTLYALLDGKEIELDKRGIGSFTRGTFHINDYKDKDILDKPNLALKIKSDLPVYAERSIYINGNLGNNNNIYIYDGTCEKGVPANKLAKTWYLPEGYTHNQNNRDFLEYLIILNPSEQNSNCQIKFMQNDGKVVSKDLNVAAKSRNSLVVNDIVSGEHSIQVDADQNILVERVIYHNTIYPPSIASIEPNSGYSPTEVTITGSNFIDVEEVLLNDQPIEYSVVDSNKITATISGSPGTYDVKVKTKRGTSDAGQFAINQKQDYNKGKRSKIKLPPSLDPKHPCYGLYSETLRAANAYTDCCSNYEQYMYDRHHNKIYYSTNNDYDKRILVKTHVIVACPEAIVKLYMYRLIFWTVPVELIDIKVKRYGDTECANLNEEASSKYYEYVECVRKNK